MGSIVSIPKCIPKSYTFVGKSWQNLSGLSSSIISYFRCRRTLKRPFKLESWTKALPHTQKKRCITPCRWKSAVFNWLHCFLPLSWGGTRAVCQSIAFEGCFIFLMWIIVHYPELRDWSNWNLIIFFSWRNKQEHKLSEFM